MKADPSEHQSYRERRFTWERGDLVLVRPGAGPPLISEAELERVLRENAANITDATS